MTSRRTVLATALGALAGARFASPVQAAPAHGATSDRATSDRVTSRRIAGTGARVDAAFPLTHLAVGWQGVTHPHVRLRTAAGWGTWKAVDSCGGGRDGAPGDTSWALLTTPATVGYELAGGTGLKTVELNTTSAARPAPAHTTLPFDPARTPLRYLSRAAWGCDDSLRFNPDGSLRWGPTQYFPVQTLTVHHTAGANHDPDPAATVRAIYYYDTITQGWGDLGYHLLIDEAGRVYEGRWSGADPIPVFGPDPGPDGRPTMVTGAHVAGYNSGNIGVVLLGDFTDQLPTPAARAALDVVLAVLSGAERLDPLGSTAYVNPISGVTATVSTISGHRDWAATQCPGNLFYPRLPQVRTEVAALLGRGAGR